MFLILFAGPENPAIFDSMDSRRLKYAVEYRTWAKGNPGHEACGKETAEEVLGDDKAIVMFRDGLSEGQFTTGMVMELTAM